ncbi:MAG TPA: hypothetical protein VFV38_39740 [Ktedonobacteraceae bacterium]|nr:hypothetical protein [Ktedonobacteraceae bacterium]
MHFDIAEVDLSQTPQIYATNNPQFFGKYCIDLAPDSFPTIASFDTEREGHDLLLELFGESQHRSWFPALYEQPHVTCRGCFGYKQQALVRRGYCSACRVRLAELLKEEP